MHCWICIKNGKSKHFALLCVFLGLAIWVWPARLCTKYQSRFPAHLKINSPSTKGPAVRKNQAKGDLKDCSRREETNASSLPTPVFIRARHFTNDKTQGEHKDNNLYLEIHHKLNLYLSHAHGLFLSYGESVHYGSSIEWSYTIVNWWKIHC